MYTLQYVSNCNNMIDPSNVPEMSLFGGGALHRLMMCMLVGIIEDLERSRRKCFSDLYIRVERQS